MGRPKMAEGEKRVPRSVKLTPAEIEWLEKEHGGVSKGMQELVQASMDGRVSRRLDAPGTRLLVNISPYSGKPLCPDCRRKGPNIKCPDCGANAKGATCGI